MKKEWIEIMKRTRRVKLSGWDSFNHYFIVLFLLLPMIFISFDGIKYLITGAYLGIRTPMEMLSVSMPFMILGIVFFFVQYKRLNFKIIKTNVSRDMVIKAIKTTATELNWIPEINTKDFKVFKTNPKWYTGSWGEHITVILDNDKVMINSICDLDKKTSVVSFGRNRKNMKRLLEELENANG
jgi:uncharacterized membrane protein